MNIKKYFALSLLCLSLLPPSAFSECRDQLCQNLQDILAAAVTDFRGYRENLVARPDISIVGAKIPCQMTEWANNVPMYICYAIVPYTSAESWYINALASLRALQPLWDFKIDSPVADHFVDAGPPNCNVPATEGPYIGHCPLHLQMTKQNDGTAKVYLWMSSLSSPYLVNRAPGMPSRSAPPSTPASCDDLCQGLKKAFESRLSGFADISAVKSNGDGVSGATLKLSGAGDCAVNPIARPHSTEAGTQYVCYWTENYVSAAAARFRDLVSRSQVLVPSEWTSHQEDRLDQLTGAKVTEWCSLAPDGKQQVCVDILGESVGLHIASWNGKL